MSACPLKPCYPDAQSYFAPAIPLSNALSLKLAYRRYSGGVFPFTGFPVHQLDKYLKILADDLGHTIVVVEEYDEDGRREALDPVKKHNSNGTDLKDRRVGRVVTPGTLVDESWVSGSESRYLLAFAIGVQRGEETVISMAYTDAATGEFFLKDSTMEHVEDELARIAPREVVLDAGLRDAWKAAEGETVLGDLFNLLRVTGVHISFADPMVAPKVEGLPVATNTPPRTLDAVAIALLRHHLQYALRDCTPELTAPDRHSTRNTMLIDAATLAALEIRHAVRPGGLAGASEHGTVSPLSSRGTLLSVMAQTMTPGGHRLLVRTLTAPSTEITSINTRLDLVEAFVQRDEVRDELREAIRSVGDVMRVIQRFKGRRGEGREAWEVGVWIRTADRLIETIKGYLREEPSPALDALVQRFRPVSDVAEMIEGAVDEVALTMGLASASESESEDAGEDGEGEVEMDSNEAVAAPTLAPAPLQARKHETKKQKQERERAQSELAKWWMRPE